MNKNESKAINVTVKADGRKIQVYKLKDGRYNIYLGENISLDRINRGEHNETFNANELKF